MRSQEDIVAALNLLKIAPHESTIEQFTIMVEALDIFQERNARYHDVWKGSGWKGSLFDLRKKVTRMWTVFWSGTPDPKSMECDDALDAINFACFFIRNIRSNNEYGDWK